MDDTRRSRFEIALKKQDLGKRHFPDDEAHARGCEAKSEEFGYSDWPSALGTSRPNAVSRIASRIECLRLVRHASASRLL
jgi:hypothetical protein